VKSKLCECIIEKFYSNIEPLPFKKLIGLVLVLKTGKTKIFDERKLKLMQCIRREKLGKSSKSFAHLLSKRLKTIEIWGQFYKRN
jgi:hypothetical protein